MTARLIVNDLIEKCNELHNYKYNYNVINYKNAHLKIEATCPIHGSFFITINNHLYNKRGCPSCGFEKLSEFRKSNTIAFIKKAIIIHNNKYDYSTVNYISAIDKIKIICLVHGEYWQIPSGHLSGKGCPNCWYKKNSELKTLSTDAFIEKANIVHNHKYNYEKAIYIASIDKVEIICPIHGIFWQIPNSHLMGCGCAKCNKVVSRKETKWLDSFGVLLERQKYLNIDDKVFFVDGFDSITNTVYEFNGDFWHGNPNIYMKDNINIVNQKTFGELYEKTIIKENIIKQAGFNFIKIWECDFDLLMKDYYE